jgi:hypothetical protein
MYEFRLGAMGAFYQILLYLFVPTFESRHIFWVMAKINQRRAGESNIEMLTQVMHPI